MKEHQQIFLAILKKSGLNQKRLSEISGVSAPTIHRFIKRGQDLKAGDFFKLLSCLSEVDQREFWSEFRGDEIKDMRKLAFSLNSHEAAELMRALVDRWQLVEISKQEMSRQTVKA
jgi:transcriptional regulator with XRE-family HTH domain